MSLAGLEEYKYSDSLSDFICQAQILTLYCFSVFGQSVLGCQYNGRKGKTFDIFLRIISLSWKKEVKVPTFLRDQTQLSAKVESI